MPGRLIVVSNRVAPVSGRQAASAGGLAVGVRAALAKRGGLWFGWSGAIVAEPASTPRLQRSGNIAYALVDLTEAEHDGYYLGFANRTLWPAFHYRIDLANFDRGAQDVWRQVNRRFAAQLLPLLRPDDRIWIHDYHLVPLGRELRRLGVGTRIGFFLHIPFPAPELFTALPFHGSLADDLCAYDVVGFQTRGDRRQFVDYLVAERGATPGEADHVQVDGHDLIAGAYPIGIDVDDVVRMASSPEGLRHAQSLAATLHGRKLVIGVDRLDYSKGIPERLRAFEQLLREHDAWRGAVTFVQISAPSREDVPEYQNLRRSVERLAGHINGRLGDTDWTPVRYVNRSYNRKTLAGFYRAARVGLVTPLRDGMNLVAAEYVAAQDPEDPGVLMLSRFAGAAETLHGAVIVNPYDVDNTATALNQALSMSQGERRERHIRMLASVRAHDIHHWRDDFLAALDGEQRERAVA
jgi:trehalose 6-phosphate synthase